LPPLPPKYSKPVNINPSTTPKTTGDVSLIASYRPTEGTPVPPVPFISQGPPPEIPTDSALEVVGPYHSSDQSGTIGWLCSGRITPTHRFADTETNGCAGVEF
uniref:Uncharacterized protein n=1 Tax=Romanomermis culicivorax TaxID=13658 RepID=A0A915JCX8_ROMCU